MAVLRDGLGRSRTRRTRPPRRASRRAPATTIGVRWPLIHAVERALRGPFRESSAGLAAAGSPSAWPRNRSARCACSRFPACGAPCASTRSAPGSCCDGWRAAPPTGSASTPSRQVYAQGVLAERFRWAELEQLVYLRPAHGAAAGGLHPRAHPARGPARAARDAGHRRRARARRSSSWATPTTRSRRRSPGPSANGAGWTGPRWGSGSSEQSVLAAATGDGHRAWVIRDALPAQPHATVAAPIRTRLAGIAQRPGAPSTSRATRHRTGVRDGGHDRPGHRTAG